MSLKRKRSESELSVSSSGSFSSFGSSPTRPIASIRSSNPSHLPSRTMKRFRDLRPSEEEVHRRTLNLLFEGARRDPASSSQPQQQRPVEVATQPGLRPTPSQRSLHSFWGSGQQSSKSSTSSTSSPSPDAAAPPPPPPPPVHASPTDWSSLPIFNPSSSPVSSPPLCSMDLGSMEALCGRGCDEAMMDVDVV